jgi:hypothetical protein
LHAPLAYLYCEDDKMATLLLALSRMNAGERNRKTQEFLKQIAQP